MKVIDARKKDCPKPVMMTREPVDAKEAEIAVLVDNRVALENVVRFLKKSGYETSHRGEEGDYFIKGKKQKADGNPQSAGMPASTQPSTSEKDRCSYMILSDRIGADSNGLGEVLMKSFLGTMPSLSPLPSVVALMNEGVRLALSGSTASTTLKELEAAGVGILVCGTCTKHFGVTDEVVVGCISNMFEIVEAVQSASKSIVIG